MARTGVEHVLAKSGQRLADAAANHLQVVDGTQLAQLMIGRHLTVG